MKMRSILSLEVVKNERSYNFTIPVGAPYGECYDAIFACLEMIIDLQKKGVDHLKSQNTEQSQEPIQSN